MLPGGSGCSGARPAAYSSMDPASLLAGLVALSLLSLLWLEWRWAARERNLRRMLGAARTALEVKEREREQIACEFNAQAVELARYRGMHAPHHRLTRVRTGHPQPPEDE